MGPSIVVGLFGKGGMQGLQGLHFLADMVASMNRGPPNEIPICRNPC